MSGREEWLRDAYSNCGIPKMKQSDLAPVSQEAIKEKMLADASAMRLAYGQHSEEEKKELEAQRQRHLEKYRELLNS
ncbi:hypothetical protein DX910_00540 [Acinetobacter haemolyticus]|nr:hypothetical protein DX910_00540 [Acinetobacter haemolyticus]